MAQHIIISRDQSPSAMNTSHEISPIRDMPHLNVSTYSNTSRSLEACNNTTIAMDETVIRGLDSQHGVANDSIGLIPSVEDDTL